MSEHDGQMTAAKAPHANGHVQEEDGDATARAEEAFDRMGEQVGKYVAEAGKWLNRLTLRAREEAEDILAEAQDMRRRWQPPS